MMRAAVVGGSGYIGGELLRLLLGHPNVELAAAVSRRLGGRRVDGVHPNLRKVTDLTFCGEDELDSYDVLFLATAHGSTMSLLPRLAGTATVIVDLAGDFRLTDAGDYERHYGTAHAAPELLGEFVTGMPEMARERLRTADRISVPGCMATAAILALRPLAAASLIDPDVVIDARTGSSGSGAAAGEHNLHAERSGAMRVFAPAGHRHEAEIAQACGVRPTMTATGVEAVRGVQVLCRATLRDGADERTVRRAYRTHYADEPFVRVVAQRRGAYRLPEPKILTGSNFCDVGFAVREENRQILAVAALDNLVKGGAGNAVQALNIRMGWPETLGLGFPGLHPV
ncbi:N-acetyl-gamma-glutamyl-phosphate reductase [Micromonospora sp. KC723]|uniref:N-acetyl-gamma-glutamyl-phosphate reductase n=1 Tax=Micromonospora sp. KC723 TaxID=2530381 RepID=UPI001048DE23|nr:N-acetyl-gamma-glutamyl-phosphate reductase [Micromonospora sp. KC723]TDB78271.1 N-acetyl-gamma-glutamyl-phosphate reductase [Micromonospora sp. KC723]